MGSIRTTVKKTQVPENLALSPLVTYKLPSGREVRSRYKWCVIAPDILPGEEILCVMDDKYLEEAQKENLGLVTYLLSEIDMMEPVRNEPEILKKIHMLKKEFGGFVTSWTPPDAVKDLKPL